MIVTPAELETLAAIVGKAGRMLTAGSRRAGLVIKPDGSPVTDADLACEKALSNVLGGAFPGLKVVGEESASHDGRLPDDDIVALIDPLDGTRAYIEGGDDFCVCLAIVERGEPRLGIIGAPAREKVYAGLLGAAGPIVWSTQTGPDGGLARARAALTARRGRLPPVALVSDRHGDADSAALLDRLEVTERINLSSALKFAVLAEGGADVYPRLAPTMAWDTAAGQAILSAAGGLTLDRTGRPMRYRAHGPLRNAGFVAMADPALAAKLAL